MNPGKVQFNKFSKYLERMMFEEPPVLFVFDLDSTLIQQESIDELAKLADKYNICSDITERAMKGELDFETSLKERTKLLKGLDAEESWSFIKRNLIFTPGAKELFHLIKEKNHINKIIIASSGFIQIAQYVKNELGADEVFANYLQVDEDGKFTGDFEPDKEFIDANAKARIIKANSQNYSYSIAVGDGYNDLQMLREATTSFATSNAKPIVKKIASHTAPELNMLSIAPLIFGSTKN